MQKLLTILVLLSSVAASAQNQPDYLPGKIIEARSGNEIRIQCVLRNDAGCTHVVFNLFEKGHFIKTISRHVPVTEFDTNKTLDFSSTKSVWSSLSPFGSHFVSVEGKLIEVKHSDAAQVTNLILGTKQDPDRFGYIEAGEETVFGSVLEDTARIFFLPGAVLAGAAVDTGGVLIASIVTPFVATYDVLSAKVVTKRAKRVQSAYQQGMEVAVNLTGFRKITRYLEAL